ncbi:MAG TPA: hypothetical protein VHO90_01645 [Bacteroidales bacterium]|nr:hypothetical protein [Bacteroidales bacterium]
MSIFYRISRYLAAIIVLFCVSTSISFAQKLKLNAFLDTTEILIGDQVRYTIELEQPVKAKVTFPVLKDSLTSKIEIIESEPADTSKLKDKLIIRRKFIITSFDSGYHKIPEYKFAFSIDDFKDTITSPELSLKVNTLPTDTIKDIADIKPVMNTPFRLSEIKKELLIGLLILVVLALIAWILIRRKKNKPLFAPRKPQEPPHITALRELDTIQAEKLWQNSQMKLYYTRITDTLRKYISGRYGINALEMTSDEILSALQDELNSDMELKSSFSKLLYQADMVKFAKEQPLPEENEVAMLSAYTFVNRTKIEVVSAIPESENTNTESGKD